jgi:hypothetical protein
MTADLTYISYRVQFSKVALQYYKFIFEDNHICIIRKKKRDVCTFSENGVSLH